MSSQQELKIKKKTYIVSDDVREIGERVMKRHDPNGLADTPAEIEYVKVYPAISKTTVARCMKVSPEHRLLSGFHYVVEVSGDVWDKLEEGTQEVLMEHELLHANPVMNDKNGEWEYKLRKHDYEDFSVIIQKYGIDWFSNLKTQVSSIFDLKPAQEDSISV